MKNNLLRLSWKSELLPLLIIAGCIASSFFFYSQFPERIVTHWNFQGQADGWSSKSFGSFFFPLLLLGIYLLMIAVPYLDPKKERYGEFAKPYAILRTMMTAIFGLIYLATSFYNLGYDLNIGAITAASIGILMIVIGNYMGKIKKNWFVGVRTPWTLSSENVWNKTHRFSGALFMLWGAVIIAVPWLPETLGLILFFGGVLAVTLGSFAYSYLIFKKEKNAK